MIGIVHSCAEANVEELAQQKLKLSPKIYYLHPLMIGPPCKWSAHLERCRRMGFDYIATPPLFAPGSSGDVFLPGDIEAAHPILNARTADDAIRRVAEACGAHGLGLILDVVLDRGHVDGAMAKTHPGMFSVAQAGGERPPDPRFVRLQPDMVYARFDEPDVAEQLVALWTDRLLRLLNAGVAGFRFHNPQTLSSRLWRTMNGELRSTLPGVLSLAWTPGLSWSQMETLAAADFGGVFSSLAWWDYRASWFVEELEILRQVAPIIACPEAPFGPRLANRIGPAEDVATAYRQALRVAAATGSGMLIPIGFEFASRQQMDARRSTPGGFDSAVDSGIDLSEDIGAASSLVDRLAALGIAGETRALTAPGGPVTTLIRFDGPDARGARAGVVVLINPDLSQPQASQVELDPVTSAAGGAFGDPTPLDGPGEPDAPLAPAEVRLVHVKRSSPVTQRGQRPRQALKTALQAPRIVIDAITPAVDGGRFAAKRLVGERVCVEADIFTDGHGVIVGELIWRAADERDWRRAPMQLDVNDRWHAAFAPSRVGRHYFTIEAWSDEFSAPARDIEIKQRAGLDLDPEIEEVRILIEQAAATATADGTEKIVLSLLLGRLASASRQEVLDTILAPATLDAMRQAAERRFLVRYQPAIRLEVERPQASFAAWYELFPRSTSPIPGRHGTFHDVIAGLPAIRAMGFDVLYLPPIHPIGKTNRKGRNNSLSATPEDPGSPYAIGAEEGGHDAIHPQLGTFEDFHRLQTAAIANGLEIAFDFAIQCSPDHPWLKQHPDWFRWRPDGSLRFAENPPKKYEDIVNVEFYTDGGVPELWAALRDVVAFWIEHGVKIFRVDNPHTKPLPFWEWLIADIRARHPDTIFLSEAFTRPKMMYRLAKIGFSQSYTYFTWRNTKRELMDYLTELTTAPVADYFRPHLFVNTPDINPIFLQGSGRAGFLIRATLAATLSGLWGMYSGFELCEAAPLPGREEYADSEKYEIKHRDYQAPGNIVAEITQLNRIRKAHPALQSHLGLTFYTAYNDHVMVYGKALPSHRDLILVAVSLDPHNVQEAMFELPLWEWGLSDDGSASVEDLMREARFIWTGKLQRVRLDPAELPFAIWRVAPLPGHRS
jgi:starch synthase (maltosyl-transferring)